MHNLTPNLSTSNNRKQWLAPFNWNLWRFQICIFNTLHCKKRCAWQSHSQEWQGYWAHSAIALDLAKDSSFLWSFLFAESVEKFEFQNCTDFLWIVLTMSYLCCLVANVQIEWHFSKKVLITDLVFSIHLEIWIMVWKMQV